MAMFVVYVPNCSVANSVLFVYYESRQSDKLANKYSVAYGSVLVHSSLTLHISFNLSEND